MIAIFARAHCQNLAVCRPRKPRVRCHVMATLASPMKARQEASAVAPVANTETAGQSSAQHAHHASLRHQANIVAHLDRCSVGQRDFDLAVR
jgi:hypothetical protein